MNDDRPRLDRRGPGRRVRAAVGTMLLLALGPASGNAVAQETGRAWEAIVPAGMERSYERSRYAPAVRIGNLLILSGVIGYSGGDDNSPEAQFVRAFERLSHVLEGTGLSLDDVAEITTYHVNLGELGRPFIAVKDRYFDEPPYPAWTAVGVDRLFLDDVLVEMRAVAVLPEGHEDRGDDEAKVRAAAQAYLDGLLDGDVRVLESAFHPETRFQGSVGDAFVGMTFSEWAESRRGKAMRPVEDYRHSIEDVLISGDAAVVRVDIDWPGTYFVDYLSLLRLGDDWEIVNKIWTQRPGPRAMERIGNFPVPPDEASTYEGAFSSGGEDGVDLEVNRAGSRLLLAVNGRRYELYFQGDGAFAPEFDVDDRLEFEGGAGGRAERVRLVLGDTTIVAERVVNPKS